MTTQAQKAWGTSVSFDGVTLGEMTSFAGDRTRNILEVFSCDSADEAVETLTSGLDEGTWTFGFVYQHTTLGNYNFLNDKYLAAKKASLVVSGPTPTGATAPTLTVTATIVSLSVPGFGSAADYKTFTAAFRISGKVTYKDSSGVTTSASPSASVSSSASA